jgi:hypothetical protein
MEVRMNFDKYKPRLKEYLRQKGVDPSVNPTRCFNTGEHKQGDKNPSLQIYGPEWVLSTASI